MKAPKSKTTSSNLPSQVMQESTPLFKREGEATFFNESPNAIQTKPFFSADNNKTGYSQNNKPFFSPTGVQAKLNIGQPNDKYEQEADAMADTVVAKLAEPASPDSDAANVESIPSTSPTVQSSSCAAHGQEEEVQRKEEETEELSMKEEQLQRKPIFESNEDPPEENNIQTKPMSSGQDTLASSNLENQLSASKGSGQALPNETANSMGSAFGADFSNVKIHTGSNAVQMNQDLGAQAFAHGSDIYFNEGKYDTGSQDGQRLLAHELTHTVQQGGANQVSTKPQERSNAYQFLKNNPSSNTIAQSLYKKEIAQFKKENPAADISKGQDQILNTSLLGEVNQKTNGAKVQRFCGCSSPPKIHTKEVAFTGNHAMDKYGGDDKNNPIWHPGSTDHAVAYNKGVAPVVTGKFDENSGAFPANASTLVTVRVKEGAAVLGSADGMVSMNKLTVDPITLTGLTHSNEVGAREYNLFWEASEDGATWTRIAATGLHRLYWLHDTPKEFPLKNFAVDKATTYATGKPDVVAAIRAGIRGDMGYSPSDRINDDPLSAFPEGIGICTDFGNVMTQLSRTVGFDANPVMFWGGFTTKGRMAWATIGGSNLNLINTRSLDPAYDPPAFEPFSPHGWAFNYHAIARVEGALHDAALNRAGFDTEAFHEGKIVRYIELGANTVPAMTQGNPSAYQIKRKNHVVHVTLKDFATYIKRDVFDEVLTLHIPPAAISPVNYRVPWRVAAGALPAGLALNPHTGLISGTPTVSGTFVVTIRAGTAAGIHESQAITIVINP